jgi:opacity protein-like surface antigen
MKKLGMLAALATLSTALAAGTAAAQTGPVRSDTRGFGIGVNLHGSTVGSEGDTGTKASSGLGVSLGYGTSDALTFFVRTDYGYRSTHLDLGARYSFGAPTAALRPYAEAGLTGSRTSRDALSATGFGVTGAVGVEYFVTPKLALDMGLGYSAGRWTNVDFKGAEVNFDRNLSAPRVNFGIKWRP